MTASPNQRVQLAGHRLLTADRLRDLLDYNPETGVFRWRAKQPKSHITVGDIAGSNRHGYRAIRIDLDLYLAHRLAWLYIYGTWPSGEIDHINQIKNDNRIANLREATRYENMHNIGLRRTNKSGYLGVSWDRHRNRWRATIKANGVHRTLGRFDTPEEASAAYVAAKARYHR